VLNIRICAVPPEMSDLSLRDPGTCDPG
jgi:hypothetical protein